MCPVCRARFRGSSECSRCGADLKTIMSLQASAWRLREAARQALTNGDPAKARVLASMAEVLHHTPAGSRIKSLSSWLADHMADSVSS